ncbi:MAG: glycosyltransferase [Clostridia bacterium]|nr:glycosyltransferase [Clostridia bacterium]
MNEDIKVTVLTLVYNNDKFIKKCLDGILSQKTNFKFEIIVHDDASKDNSRKIIEEYAKKYPEIVVPICQDENQMSKGVRIVDEVMFPKARGKYIAFCEGDDFWIDDLKLQKQFDYMEEHLEYSACFHNTIKHDLLGKRKDKKFNNWKEIHELTDEEVFEKWLVHTSSYFMRREFLVLPEQFVGFWFGDYVRLCYLRSNDKVVALPDTMSVYNFNNVDGVFYKATYNFEKNMKIVDEKIRFCNIYNLFTNYKFKDIINKKIEGQEFEKLNLKIMIAKNKEEFNSLKKQIFSSEFYKKINFKKKIKLRIKYFNYRSFNKIRQKYL